MPRLNRDRPTMGSDPEMFIVDGDDNVVPASSIGLRKSSTDDDIVFDNAAVELRPTGRACIEHLLPRLQGHMMDLKKMLDNDERDLDITLDPAREISSDILSEHDGCMEFGCDPSKVYGKGGVRVSQPKVDPEDTNIRSIGFHIHLGKTKRTGDERGIFDEKQLRAGDIVHDITEQVKIVELCDIFLGLIGVMMEQDRDEMVRWRRQELGYGVAGEFRQQPHGLEYRTLGPWPLRHLTWSWWAYSTARDCYYIVLNDLHEQITEGVDRNSVIDAINQNDESMARQLWNKARHNLVKAIDGWSVISTGNQALLSPTNIRRLEFALSENKLETYFPDETMWESWESYSHHRGECFPARVNRKTGKNFRRFCGMWNPGCDNISNWESGRGSINTIRVRGNRTIKKVAL